MRQAKCKRIQPGDHVIYRDRDQIPWGPWKVVRTQEDTVTVVIDQQLEYAIHSRLLNKVGLNPA